MTLHKSCRVATVLGAMATLSACSTTLISIAYNAEMNRLDKLERWEAKLAVFDCAQLDEEYTAMSETRDTFVDFDQRQDIMRDQMNSKNCALPEDLS